MLASRYKYGEPIGFALPVRGRKSRELSGGQRNPVTVFSVLFLRAGLSEIILDCRAHDCRSMAFRGVPRLRPPSGFKLKLLLETHSPRTAGRTDILPVRVVVRLFAPDQRDCSIDIARRTVVVGNRSSIRLLLKGVARGLELTCVDETAPRLL